LFTNKNKNNKNSVLPSHSEGMLPSRYSNSFGFAASTRRLGRMIRPEKDKEESG